MSIKIGLNLPQFGGLGTAQNVKKISELAEQEDFDSLWVIERQLWPVNPQTDYPPTEDGSWPKVYQSVLDAIETLSYVSAITSKVKIGTCVIDMLYYSPLILAKRLATLDNLSEGRLLVGLGMGHSKDEFDSVGVPYNERGKRTDEFLEVIKKIWTQKTVEHKGKFFTIPKSIIGPKPYQKPHPPIYLGGFSQKTFDRIARTDCQGWLGIPLPNIETYKNMVTKCKDTVKQAGKGEKSLEFPTLIFPEITKSDSDNKGNKPFVGSLEKVTDEIKRLAKFGINRIIMSPYFSSYGNDLDRIIDEVVQVKRKLD